MYRKQYCDPKWLTEFVNKYIKSLSLNLCCGKSQIGDVKADIDSKVKPDIICDMWELPFKRASFDSIYCDPEWHNISLWNRKRLLYLLRDYLKRDGFLIWNCSWGFLKLPNLKTLDYIYHNGNRFGSITITIVYQKINAQIDEYSGRYKLDEIQT